MNPKKKKKKKKNYFQWDRYRVFRDVQWKYHGLAADEDPDTDPGKTNVGTRGHREHYLGIWRSEEAGQWKPVLELQPCLHQPLSRTSCPSVQGIRPRYTSNQEAY